MAVADPWTVPTDKAAFDARGDCNAGLHWADAGEQRGDAGAQRGAVFVLGMAKRIGPLDTATPVRSH